MQLISLDPLVLTKDVEYFGIQLTVLERVDYIATDENGDVYGYENHPTQKERWEWGSNCDPIWYKIGTVDLDGIEWFNTCKSV